MWNVVIDILLILVLAGACVLGTLLTMLQLPGTWLIAAAAAGYAWLAGSAHLSWTLVLICLGICVAAEIFEATSGAVLARTGGASRRAAWYGLGGGLLGAILLTVPVPLIGTVIGAIIGCFAGAFLAEMQEGRTLNEGARSGAFAAVGRALGSMAKLLAAVVLSVMVVVSAVAGQLR